MAREEEAKPINWSTVDRLRWEKTEQHMRDLRAAPPAQEKEGIPAFHSGGRVRKTGVYRLRKGEHVLSREQVKNHVIQKALRDAT